MSERTVTTWTCDRCEATAEAIGSPLRVLGNKWRTVSINDPGLYDSLLGSPATNTTVCFVHLCPACAAGLTEFLGVGEVPS